MIAIEMLNRIDRILIFYFQSDPDRKNIAGF